MTDESVAVRPQPAGSSRTTLLAGTAVGLVICAVVGSVGGYLLADGDGDDPGSEAGSPPAATASARPTATTRSVKPTQPRPSRSVSTPPPVGQMVLPDLVGTDFEEARDELRQRGLGWRIVFGSAGSDRRVGSTDPRAGTTVRRGITVRLSVVGAAPSVAVPDLVGRSCQEAAKRLVDEGLSPDYPAGRSGEVRSQDPEPAATSQWNGQVRIYCGEADGPSSPPAG
ncbi:PASTA domain-containing protein [Plantactinospora sp. CA-290183]|uniref:PASTA domain-containing protein n=1 Tax=Plantactinospora sp. CA-290183 TaxID=3240006 RepID=UPI003D8EA5C3